MVESYHFQGLNFVNFLLNVHVQIQDVNVRLFPSYGHLLPLFLGFNQKWLKAVVLWWISLDSGRFYAKSGGFR